MSDAFRLDGKRIVVTGASSDIGRAIAVACASVGATVVATGRNSGRLADTRAQVIGKGGTCEVIAADLATDEGRRAVADAAGQVDGIVHATATTGPRPVRQLTSEFLHHHFDGTYLAPMLLTQVQLARGGVRDGGAIIFITSISAHMATRGMSTYSGMKAALVASAGVLALEVAPRAIRVNCISPAIVRTSVFDHTGETWLAEQAKRYPLGLGEPEDVAHAAVFLLSPASRWITGETLLMTGACSMP